MSDRLGHPLQPLADMPQRLLLRVAAAMTAAVATLAVHASAQSMAEAESCKGKQE